MNHLSLSCKLQKLCSGYLSFSSFIKNLKFNVFVSATVALRMISFGCDYHWSDKNSYFDQKVCFIFLYIKLALHFFFLMT